MKVLDKNKVKVSVCSSLGVKRKINQDNFFVNGFINRNRRDYIFKSFFSRKNEQIAAIFDGMGGEKHGETAAFIASEKLDGYRKKYSNLFDRFEEHVISYVESGNKAICEYMLNHDNERMGTTLALLCLSPEKNEAVAANVGDSKVFLFRENDLKKISEDHNQAQRLVNMKIITEEEARIHPSKSKLTQHLGIYPEEMALEPYVSDNIILKKNDIFMLCSDGLTDMLSNNEIVECLKKNNSIKTKCKNLVKAADENGGKDNTTVILLEVK